MNEKLELIRKACIKANPSIMELGFGCEVEWRDEKATLTGQVFTDSESKERYYSITPSLKGVDTFSEKDGYWKILGRPIRLADVLLAIHAQTADRKVTGFWTVVGENGEFAKLMLHEGELENCNIAWNLLKDDLRQQSEETVDFLYDLLK